MPTLTGTMPYEHGPQESCVWCSSPTDLRFAPQGWPVGSRVPLHMLCAMQLLTAYERWRRGQTLDGWTMAKLARVEMHQLSPGPT